MKTKPLKYEITTSALENLYEQSVDENAKLDLHRKKDATKGNTFVMIKNDTKEISYIVPIFLNEKFYAGEIPKPTTLFMVQAIEFNKKANELIKDFPNHILMDMKQKDGKISFQLVDNKIYHLFLMYKISSLTAIISTVESFINEFIPDNFTTENSKGETINKTEIERKWDIKSKLKTIIPKIITIESKDEYLKLSNKFIELSKMRNEFIHLKTATNETNKTPYIDHFELLINVKLDKKIQVIQELINMIKPNYFK
jgi:hypothetical protein